jgi:hypothetical protein
MPLVVDSKEVGGEFKNDEYTLRVIYDFSKDAGAIGTIDLFEAKSDIVLTGFHAVVKGAVTSAGAATVEAGYTGATNGLLTAKLQAALTANAVLPKDGAAAAARRIPAGDKITQTIAVAALTAGRVEYVIKYMSY